MNKAQNAIEKIHEFERFGSVLGLERMTELLHRLGDPQEELKVIHIAGTNGKGSVSRYIYSVLREAGYRAGLYTSPFLETFNERIELDGSLISDEDLSVYTDLVLAAARGMVRDGFDSPTEFEVVTAIAFLYFKEKGCDYVVLEVGLGGRGDSTNVCRAPLMTVITSISMDHMDRLGDTIEEIAAEKAGIIKDGCPVVTSARDPRALKVIEETAAEHKSLFFESARLPVTIREESIAGSCFDVDVQGVTFTKLRICMAGRHQIENAVAAVAALSLMEERGDVSFTKQALYEGLAKARQTGRFEVLSAEPGRAVLIADGAHNEDGARALRETMQRLLAGKKVLIVTGVLADKAADKIMAEFLKFTDEFIVSEPVSARRMDAQKLAALLRKGGARCEVVPDPEDACLRALARAKDYEAVLFAGSLYLIGKVRSMLKIR